MNIPIFCQSFCTSQIQIFFSSGFGSVGTIVEGPFIAFLLTHFGWSGTFYAMVILGLISAAAVGKAAFQNTSVDHSAMPSI